MNPLFLGYLYFHMTITPIIANLDPFDVFNTTEHSFKNCTQCNVKPSSACACKENIENGGCLVCCLKDEECCFCGDCSVCWRAEWQLTTMTHISISILFVLGITGLFLMYCKFCNRTRRLARTRCLRVQQALDGTTHCSTVEDLRDRPPPYSEVCGAPPLYTSPYNRASMQDAPPRYPDTPKPQDRCRCVRDTFASSAPHIAQHM